MDTEVNKMSDIFAIGADRALFASCLGEKGGGGLGAKLSTMTQEAIFLGETANY